MNRRLLLAYRRPALPSLSRRPWIAAAAACVAACVAGFASGSASAAEPALADRDDGGLVLRSMACPTDTPGDLAWDGAALWIADWQRGELLRFDPESETVLQRVEAPCYRPRGLAWGNGLLYVADDFEGKIYVFDPKSGRTITRYAAPSPGGLGLAWDGTALWLSDNGDNTLQRLIPADGTALTYFDAPQREPDGMTYDGTYLWVAQRGQDRVYMVDPTTGEALTSFDSPGPYPCGLAPAPGERLWLADSETGLLYLCAPRETRGYQTSDWRDVELRMTYRIVNEGPGSVVDASVNFAIPPKKLENQIETEPISYFPEQPVTHDDQWEQPIATFTRARIGPGERCEVGYATRGKLAGLNYILIPERTGTLADIPKEIRERYTADADRFQVNSPLIQETAKRIVGVERNPYWIARKIFDWVIQTLEYDRVGGWDVPETLIKRKTGSCSEYTFLYIGLCRAAGLPARYEAGTAVRGDDACVDDVYHRWAEVYLPNYGWIPIDPSGGDQPTPGSQADFIGRLSNRLFVTTHGGGDSNALAWDYNGHARYSLEGRCALTEDAWIAWRRAKEEGQAVVPSGAHVAP